MTKNITIPYMGRSKTGGKVAKDLMDVIDTEDTWEKNGLIILSLKGVQKLALAEEVVEKKIVTEITPTEGNKQQHVVNIWVGFKDDVNPDNWVRASGEASILNTGKVVEDKKGGTRRYEEFGCIDSQYRYAMADKRAYCRAVIKLLNLFNIYSAVESSSFAPEAIKGYDY